MVSSQRMVGRKYPDVSKQTCYPSLRLAEDQEAGGKRIWLAAREDGIKYVENIGFLTIHHFCSRYNLSFFFLTQDPF